MSVTIKTRGFRELERALAEELPKATAKNVLRRTAINVMGRIEDKAKQFAPKEQGDLADSITTRPTKAKRASATRYEKSSGVSVATGPAPVGTLNRSNASWQEWGTVNMPANSYMRPAADAEGQAVIDDVREELTAQIGKAKSRIARKVAKARA